MKELESEGECVSVGVNGTLWSLLQFPSLLTVGLPSFGLTDTPDINKLGAGAHAQTKHEPT